MTILSDQLHLHPDQLGAYWMPFTSNRQFKAAPRMIVQGEGMYYTDADGRKVLDGFSGLWCCNAGHCPKPIVEAIQKQAAVLDYCAAFQMSHPLAFELANRIVEIGPKGLGHVFYANSGSEAVDTALKIALAYQRVKGEASRTRLIGRERGYHGVGFGGISVGGMVANRKMFGAMLAGVDHLPHTHNLAKNAYTKGIPEHGVELADELERLVALHDASTIAAVIVEPMAGSTGVLLPPKGYLKRLREITKKHGILLIFDEVITAYGRMGGAFASQVFDVVPDMITFAKGITSGTVPMGGVLVSDEIHDAFMVGPPGAVEFFHGYTYSAHPLACAAGIATLQHYKDEDLFARGAKMGPVMENAVHSLKGTKHVIDLRNYGLVGAVELESRPGAPGARAFDVYLKCWEKGVVLRTAGDTVAIAPSLIVKEDEIGRIVTTLREAILETA
ncbi:aspartate aminotransferase family protein [Usitatibacter palustris]|uniref:Beta-alanine--pyruvate aminotransferase n=1 Tax=Usitatibacter palustris TaxID=2732487 RepID=A0A6M4H2K3_9PROT|nr:aspartate aminotransferase family protein [Usitatibacter palustris]QJR13769.1 Beta-alanine--pyruvate aminotransferase [Usitatibacter palustris]